MGSPRTYDLLSANQRLVCDPLVAADGAVVRGELAPKQSASVSGMSTAELFVNGTLMRGDVLHGNLDGARFISEARTAPRYRLYSIGDVHPGMIPVDDSGVSVSGEIYELDLEHLERIIAGEPPGLGIGVVELAGGERRLGVFWVAPDLPATALDISEYGGWRAYRAQQTAREKGMVGQ
jgi:gamma-glutamylcyclotransferase (GGCT)/AIG2-like uncharacterized protein YtfP